MSRKEYLDRAQALIDWRMNNLSKNEEFLNKVDAEWSYLCYPVTEKEYKLLNQIMIMFSALDERYRCDEKRSKLRDIHFAQIEESKKRLDELERKKRLEQEALTRDKKEQEQQNAENAKLKAEAERQSKTGLTAIKAEADRYLIRCLKALRESALAGNDSKLKEEIAQAEIFIRTTRTFTAQEKNVLLQLQKTLRRMPAEYQALQKIFSRFFAIKARHHIRIVPAPGKPTVLITEIRPGVFVCRANDEEVIVDYKSMSVETRKTWLHHLKRTKIPSPEFYSDLLHGKKPNIKLVPKGFWKDVWPIAEKGMF